ncbi:MAG: ABC transporter substrate-binding protein [Desulfosarcina sp.]|nr:ABC transporter substrate-binding protein [Desulfosarcina sp.]MBC2767313.1 ABC transporter substrate-binding protein [Desulfosarcina sp.]
MNKLGYKAYSALFLAITLLFFMTITVGGAWAEEMPEKLVIGYQAVPNPETVVKDLGWNEKTLGIPVKWVKYDSGRHVNQALAQGKVDIGLVGTSPCAAAISQGLAIEVIWVHDVIGDSEALAVKKDSNIKTVANLVGKRVAAPFGSTTHYHLMLALKLANVPPEKLKLINLEPKEMPAAWQQGDIDAAFVWQPTLSVLLEQGGEVILSSRQMAERGFPTADLCVARKEFATKYPSVVIQYLKNLDKAVKFCRSVGDMNLSFGLYTLLKETADFLARSGEIASSPSWPVFMRAVSASYVQKVIVKKKATLAGPRPKSE